MGISDTMFANYAGAAIDQHPRFEIVGTASNSIMTQTIAEQTQPDVIILSDQSPGTPGSAILGDLAAIGSRPLIILTTADESGERSGPDFVVPDRDFDALNQALDSTAAYLDNPTEQPDRRGGGDRRIEQDWSKVFAERRVNIRRSTDEDAARAV